jgi:acetolactate synthase-1/2/3 large subunit
MDAVFIDESQTFSWFFKRYFSFTNKHIAYSSIASHLGWGLPFACGSSVHFKNKKVVCLISDASFLLGVQTLATLSKYNLPVLSIVMNNGGFSSLKIEMQNYIKFKTQNINYLTLPDNKLSYPEIASGMGIKAESLDKPSDLLENMSKYYKTKGPSLLDIKLNNDLGIWSQGWYKAPAR